MLQIIGKGGFSREVASYYGDSKTCVMYENEEINNMSPFGETIIAIGDPHTRKRISESYHNVRYIIFNKGKLYAGSIDTGSIICPGTIMTTNVKIGRHVIVNLNVTIGHDCNIGDFTTISPGVNISGNVNIGKLCYIGSNAVIREKINICDNVIIGAGSVVIKDITESGTYVGNPAKKIK